MLHQSWSTGWKDNCFKENISKAEHIHIKIKQNNCEQTIMEREREKEKDYPSETTKKTNKKTTTKIQKQQQKTQQEPTNK